VTVTSDAAAQAAIGAAARELKLPTVRDQATRLAEIAARDHAGYLAYLAEVLAAELDDRSARRRARRIAEARFPRLKRLADFSTDAVPTITPGQLAHLATGAYLAKGEPVVLLGDSGTGKTHLLIGLGLAACEQGRTSVHGSGLNPGNLSGVLPLALSGMSRTIDKITLQERADWSVYESTGITFDNMAFGQPLEQISPTTNDFLAFQGNDHCRTLRAVDHA